MNKARRETHAPRQAAEGAARREWEVDSRRTSGGYSVGDIPLLSERRETTAN